MDDSENSVEEIQKLNAANKVEEENDKGVEQYEEKDVPTEFTLQPHHAAQELQLSGQLTSSLELSPTFVTESLLSVPSLNLRGDKESSSGNTNCTVVAGTKQENFLDSRIVSATKVSSDDGYNWRKYGHKEVKSPHGSRSYYKCTYLECYAKKIECSDDRNFVVEVIYKSDHNHDPPKKRNCTRKRKLSLLAAPIVRSNNTCHPVRTVSNTESPKPLGENIQIKHIPEANQQVSCGSSEDSQRIVLKEHINGHKAKVRVNKNGKLYPVPISKPSKKTKFVVRVAGGVGISGDGYRWRKYGQKMVKGTPHPRNYYRCTSAGCPVRKHIEMANDCKSTLVITYKGMHDHDMPVPKKRHGPPSAPLLAASPVSLGTKEINEPEAYEKHISAAQWSVDKAES